MRIRLKGYADYGLSPARVKEILVYCRTAPNDTIIKQAAEKAYPVIARYLVESLKDGIGYDRLYTKYYIPLSCGDFYGYRRLTISLLDKMIPKKE